jgi:hypothetical protein
MALACCILCLQGNEYWSAGNQFPQYNQYNLPRNQPQPQCSITNANPITQCTQDQCQPAPLPCGSISDMQQCTNRSECC